MSQEIHRAINRTEAEVEQAINKIKNESEITPERPGKSSD